jgi:hypothetical protein
MATLPTVAINRDGHRLIINQADFNPDVDIPWDDTQSKAKPKTTPPTSDGIPAALALINGSDVVRDISIIPTVGQAAVKVILENRPEGGYTSLGQVWELCPEILGGRIKVDPEAVAAWGG